MIEAWVAGSVSVTVITEGTPIRITTTARLQDVGITPQMTEKTWKETVMTIGAGQGKGETTKGLHERVREIEKGGMIEERGIDLPQEAGADHPHHPVRVLILPFGVGEARMIGTLSRTDGRPTRNRRFELKKQAEVCNILRPDDR